MQVLIFEIDGYKYAVTNQHIESLIRRQPIQPVPNAPSKVAGMTSVRDTAYMVIDLCSVLFSKRAKYSTEQIFILTSNQISYIVDRVVSVCELKDNEVFYPSSLVNIGDKSVVNGFFKQGDDIVTILNFNIIDDMC